MQEKYRQTEAAFHSLRSLLEMCISVCGIRNCFPVHSIRNVIQIKQFYIQPLKTNHVGRKTSPSQRESRKQN